MSILLVAAFTFGCTATVTPTNQTGNATPTNLPTRQYTIATGGVAGTYYPIGTGIAYAVNNASAGMVMSVEATGASVANCRLLQNKTCDFALVQTMSRTAAVNGAERLRKQGKLSNIQGVACLYPETIQLITLANSGIKSVSDLKGKNVVMGDRGSGSWFNALEILTAYDLTESDVKPSAVKLAQAAEMMKNGQVDAAFWTGGAPTGSDHDTGDDQRHLHRPHLRAQRVTELMNPSSFYAKYTLPANTYRGITTATRDGHRDVHAGRQQGHPRQTSTTCVRQCTTAATDQQVPPRGGEEDHQDHCPDRHVGPTAPGCEEILRRAGNQGTLNVTCIKNEPSSPSSWWR